MSLWTAPKEQLILFGHINCMGIIESPKRSPMEAGMSEVQDAGMMELKRQRQPYNLSLLIVTTETYANRGRIDDGTFVDSST